ncbi:MAG: hypothetical protein ACK6BZ_05115 [Candidatus Kapaibacterium sp.]|jgi:tetratricopeptide (TPR) repeat protein
MKFTSVLVLGLFFTLELFGQSAFEQAKTLTKNGDYTSAGKLLKQIIREESKNQEALFLVADIYSELEKQDSSYIVSKKAYEIDDTPEAVRRYATAMTKKGQGNEAVTLMEKLIKSDASAENYSCLGNLYLLMNNSEKAEISIIRAREVDKKNPKVYVALGDLYYAKRVYELSKDNYITALEFDDKLLDARIKLAQSYYELAVAEPDTALFNELFLRSLQEWNTITKQDSNNARAFFQQGKILFQASRFGSAAASFYRYSQLRPDVAQGRWYFAQSLFKSGQWDSASVQLTWVKQSDLPDSVKKQSTIYLAQAYFNTKNFEKSVAAYKESKQMMTLGQDELERYGFAAVNAKDTTLAISIFDEAIAGPQKKCNLMFRYALLLKDKKMYSKSNEVFTKRIKECNDENTIKAKLFIGVNLFSDNKAAEAIPVFKEYIAADPTSMYARRMLANSFASITKNDSARAVLLAAYEYSKTNTSLQKSDVESVLQSLCKNYLDAKDFSNTVKYAKLWAEFNPESENAYLFMAIGYHGQNDKDNACKNYKETLKKNPNNPVAKRNVGSLGC